MTRKDYKNSSRENEQRFLLIVARSMCTTIIIQYYVVKCRDVDHDISCCLCGNRNGAAIWHSVVFVSPTMLTIRGYSATVHGFPIYSGSKTSAHYNADNTDGIGLHQYGGWAGLNGCGVDRRDKRRINKNRRTPTTNCTTTSTRQSHTMTNSHDFLSFFISTVNQQT